MSGAVLAIDFGTTNSAATLTDEARVTQLREPSSGGWAWPSAVFIDGNLPLIGTTAVNRKRLRPSAFREELKRFLGQNTPLYLGGRQYPPTTLVTLVLQSIRLEAERIHGASIGRTVITVPASYGPSDLRLDEMRTAARDAGMPAVEFVPEPVAAALAPVAGEPLRPGTTVLVYDFGGGTFDAAVVRLGHGATPHSVLGYRALDDCGGRDLDAAVRDYLRASGGAKLTDVLDADATDEEARTRASRARLQLVDLARELKHRASRETLASEIFDPADVVLSLDQQKLRALAQPLIERTGKCCVELIESLGLTRDDVDQVMVVGGSSRIPGVVDHLASVLRRPIRQAEDAETAVSQGAAAWAGSGPVRTATAQAPSAEREPLCWTLPPGSATLLEWRVAPGSRYDAGDVLGRVRTADGGLVDLAATRAGIVRLHHVHPGDPVLSGDWLVTTERG